MVHTYIHYIDTYVNMVHTYIRHNTYIHTFSTQCIAHIRCIAHNAYITFIHTQETPLTISMVHKLVYTGGAETETLQFLHKLNALHHINPLNFVFDEFDELLWVIHM